MSYAERRKQKLTGWWFGEVEVQNGAVRYRRRFKSKGEADGYEAYVRATGVEPNGISSAPTLPFRTVADRLKAAHPTWGRKDPSSIQRLETICGRIGDLDINAVDTTQLDKLVDWLVKRPGKTNGQKLSDATINRYLTVASKVLRFAFQRKLIPSMVYVPLRECKSERLLTVSFDQEDAIVRYIEARDTILARYDIGFLVRVLAATGFRKGELWKLKPEQLTVVTRADPATGEQIEEGWATLEPDQTKTDKARTVYIEPAMLVRLRVLIASGKLPNAFRVYRLFKEAAIACGGNAKLTLHSLRHTRATRLIAQGVDSLIVADLLGHSSLSTTRKYTHPELGTLAEASKKVHQARGELAEKSEVVRFTPTAKTA